MKQKSLNNLKKLYQKPIVFNDIIMVSVLLTVPFLSMANNYLFLKEMVFCTLIVGITVLSTENKINE